MLELIASSYSGEYWFARFLLLKGLSLVYFIAFINAYNQFTPLLGENGLLPLPRLLQRLDFKAKPSIFHWHYSDRFFKTTAIIGILLSVTALTGVAGYVSPFLSMAIWFLMWVLYLSIVNVGVVFYGFGWESMLLEAGFYAIFLGSPNWTASFIIIFLFRWMLFRVEFGAGLIKMRGDRCWRDLTCLNYHHETQPLPNVFSRYFHLLPESLHKLETLFNHLVQLVFIWGLFLPQPFASLAAAFVILSQAYLIISGNYSWLNWLTIILAFSGLSDEFLHSLLPIFKPQVADVPHYYQVLLTILAMGVVYLSIKPVKNMLSSRQKMNFSFNPFHLVNTYGAFGSVTKQRYEIIIEGTREKEINGRTEWKEYQFKGKPGSTNRHPPIVSPYHLRLDWQMWFAAMSTSPEHHPWFKPFVLKLLKGERQITALLKNNPFKNQPPKFIRARLFKYEFTDMSDRKKTCDIWRRTYVHDYLPPISLEGTVFYE